MSKKYLFVSGCPRSGTTVLAQMLNWADEAFVGLERYQGLIANSPERFVPALFEQERLASFERGDCGYLSYAAKPEYNDWFANPKDFGMIGDLATVGDKITGLYRYFDVFRGPEWQDHDVTVLHIVRNVVDVASSYQSRKNNEKDGWQQDYLAAIADWVESVDKVSALSKAPIPGVKLAIVDYDSMFASTQADLSAAARALFGFLDLRFGPKQLNGMSKVFINGEQRRSKRTAHENIRSDVEERVPAAASARHAELRAQAIGASA
jgi:hypothetical protein